MWPQGTYIGYLLVEFSCSLESEFTFRSMLRYMNVKAIYNTDKMSSLIVLFSLEIPYLLLDRETKV
jgi:hypothetical protein